MFVTSPQILPTIWLFRTIFINTNVTTNFTDIPSLQTGKAGFVIYQENDFNKFMHPQLCISSALKKPNEKIIFCGMWLPVILCPLKNLSLAPSHPYIYIWWMVGTEDGNCFFAFASVEYDRTSLNLLFFLSVEATGKHAQPLLGCAPAGESLLSTVLRPCLAYIFRHCMWMHSGGTI